MNDRFLLRTAISRLSFLNTEEKKILEKKLDTVSRLALLSIDDLSLAVGRVINSRLWQTEQKQSSMEEQALHDVRIMEAFGIQAVFYDDESYPALLKEIYDPPYALFYRGNMSVLNMACVSIVGTRRPTGLGMRHTKDLACEFAAAGFTVVSGLALGTDACAHAGALRSENGKTAAVLGSGVDTVTPAANKTLAAALLKNGGCIVSEYAPGTPPEKWHFPQRNRIISALSPVTVVVEAPPGSGALITADFALEQNRELCFHSCASEYEKAADRSLALRSTKKNARRVSQYIDEGASFISCAADVIKLIK